MMLIEAEAMGRNLGKIVIADCSKCVFFLLSLAMACMLSAACRPWGTWNGSRLARLIYRPLPLEMRVLKGERVRSRKCYLNLDRCRMDVRELMHPAAAHCSVPKVVPKCQKDERPTF